MGGADAALQLDFTIARNVKHGGAVAQPCRAAQCCSHVTSSADACQCLALLSLCVRALSAPPVAAPDR